MTMDQSGDMERQKPGDNKKGLLTFLVGILPRSILIGLSPIILLRDYNQPVTEQCTMPVRISAMDLSNLKS